MNTQSVIKKLQLWGGSLALLAAGGLAYTISKSIAHYKKYHRDFDPETVEELKGRVLEVTADSDKPDQRRGMILILETENQEIIPVHLGPEWFIRHQRISFGDNAKITVTGSRVHHRDNPVLVVSEILVGDKKLVFRDEDGHPRWQSWINRDS